MEDALFSSGSYINRAREAWAKGLFKKKLENGMKALIKQEERLMLSLHAQLSM